MDIQQALSQLQTVVAQINDHLAGSGQKLFLANVPDMPGAQTGFATWSPGTGCSSHVIPGHVVFNRENVALGPGTGADEKFDALMQAEHQTFAELATAAGQLGAMTCTFETVPDATGVKNRTCFNISQWTTADAASAWARASPGHRLIMEHVKKQTTATWLPSVLASYAKTRGQLVYKCVRCHQMQFAAAEPLPGGICHACSHGRFD